MREISVQKRFILISLIFGMLFVFMTPPFQVPDEDSHFKKAYVIAKGGVFPQVNNGVLGYELPEEMSKYIAESTKVIGNRDEKVSYSEMILDERLPKDYSKTEFQNFSTVGSNPIAHIIPAIGILFGKVVSWITKGGMASINYLLYFARFFNLLAYIAIVAVSIKITPKFKKTMCLAGILPMSLFLAASISYDMLMISITFLSTALILKFIDNGDKTPLSNKYLILLAFLGAILILIKPVYFTVFLLLFLTPKEKFVDKKDYWKKILLFVGIIALIYLLFMLPPLFYNEPITSGDSTLVNEQTNYIISHPFAFFFAFIKSIREQMDFLIPTTIGVFGLIDTYMPSAFIYIYSLVLLITGIFEACEEKEDNFDLRKNVLTFISVFIGILGIFFIMYLSWTPKILGFGVGAETITGVQGRYFIPFIPIGFLCFNNTIVLKHGLFRKLKKYVLEYSFVFAIGLLMVSSLTMILRYYIG